MMKIVCAASLLICALGCRQNPEATDINPGNSTNAKHATKDIGRTDYAPEGVPTLTNGATVGDNPRETLMSVWRSPESTAEERANALTKWLPRDTTMASAEALLGNDGRWSHRFGLSLNAPQHTNGDVTSRASGIDVWVLEYDTQGGLVALRFPQGPEGPRFGGAYAEQRRAARKPDTKQ